MTTTSEMELIPITLSEGSVGSGLQSPSPLPPPTKVDTLIAVLVPNGKIPNFQKWLAEIYEIVASFKGFRNRHVHKLKSEGGFTEFLIVLVFDDLPSQKKFMSSVDRAEKVKELVPMGVKVNNITAYGGNQDGMETSDVDGGGDIEKGVADTVDGEVRVAPKRIFLQAGMGGIPKPRPPPKWKLTLVLTVTVFVSIVVVIFGGSIQVMAKAGLPPGLFLFITAAHVVTFLIYALLPLAMSVPLVNKWLRASRPPVDQMHPLHAVLDQGLKMFAIKMQPPEINPTVLVRRLDKLEAKLDRLREVNYRLNTELQIIRSESSNVDSSNHTTIGTGATSDATAGAGAATAGASGAAAGASGASASKYLDATDRQLEDLGVKHQTSLESNDSTTGLEKPLTMAVRHYVRWECVPEFEAWTDAIDNEMKKWPGYMGMVRLAPKEDGDAFINSFSFDNYAHLMNFSRSSIRDELLRKLEPLLEATSQAEINEERTFSDAFTELMVPTGGNVASRPPPLWKTVILTTISLHIIIWQMGYNLTPYLASTGMPPLLVSFLVTTLNVIVNSYIGVPLMQSQFGDWMNAPRPLRPLEYLSFLDSGLPRYGQIALVVIYYGLNILFAILNGPPE